MSLAAAAKISPEEFLATPDHKGFELVDGEMVELNVGLLSSRIAGVIYRKLDNYSEANRLGQVWPG